MTFIERAMKAETRTDVEGGEGVGRPRFRRSVVVDLDNTLPEPLEDIDASSSGEPSDSSTSARQGDASTVVGRGNRVPSPVRSVPASNGSTPGGSSSESFVDMDPPFAGAPGSSLVSSEPSRRLELPRKRLVAERMLVPEEPASRIAEEYRVVKRPLLAHIAKGSPEGAGPANVVMVTSCLAGEGKTYSSLNLAISIALEPDRSVVLVDTDVIRARAGSFLGIPRDRAGLTDLLIEPSLDLGSVVWQTDLPNLRVLPAGRPDSRATELLASSLMANLVARLAASAPDAVVILDAPPLLATSEANALATHAGQIVFVVRAEKTSTSQVVNTLQRLSSKARVGLLFNEARRHKAAPGYGYNYNYAIAAGDPHERG